jgi:RNA polymerase sigma-70 factor (ECF subfamily)
LQPIDPAAFEAAVLPHLDAAYTLARYLLRDDADAEDAVQEACLRALRYFAGFRGVEGRAWLLRIVRNTCFTWRRRRKADAAVVSLDVDLHEEHVGGESPEDALLLAASRDALHAAIDALPAEFREVIVLRELEGLSYGEIGEVAGVPVGTVMSRLSRARKRLQHALRPRAPEAI